MPNVDSALVRLDRHEQPLGTPTERERVFSVVDAAFALALVPVSALALAPPGAGARAVQARGVAGGAPGARGETLEVEQFRAIAAAGAGRDAAVATPSPRPSREPR